MIYTKESELFAAYTLTYKAAEGEADIAIIRIYWVKVVSVKIKVAGVNAAGMRPRRPNVTVDIRVSQCTAMIIDPAAAHK